MPWLQTHVLRVIISEESSFIIMIKKRLLTIIFATASLMPMGARQAEGAIKVAAKPQHTEKGIQTDVSTHRQYLSGKGCDDMVEWDFMCTDGRQSGKWTKIGVPSCWELQGFGTYQYGMRFYGKATAEGIADEKGLYKTEFTLPESWAGRQILLVFEAAMTDAKVTINGRKAGDIHQGGFYRFQHDVSDRIFFGKKKNRLEVEVSKESANSQVNMAERRADYWNFGGLIRPVFVVSKPSRNIRRVAINAGMDGRFQAEVHLNRALEQSMVEVSILDAKGKTVGSGKSTSHSDLHQIDFSVSQPLLWTAETPHLYTALFTLKDSQGKVLHEEREKFGFRTIEYRASDGVYINGHKVIFKGVNRHSFRPESGRTLSKAKNIEDVVLIKSMNMNAVRLSHYPADPEFLDACDSLGLYVENELSGWHWAHETIVGQKLVEEMVTRDVNHPSVIFWSNGNEGGFNYELEPFFGKFDPQKRVVLYPWANRNGFETKHYRSWGETAEYMRQKEIFMPTEFLHGLYDGGHGAGLRDYWDLMMSNKRCAGGFLWDLADQGVVRTDMDGLLDCQGNNASDGILGPHFEKEGSYYTIKQLWSPIELEWGENAIFFTNHYDFTHLKDCRFTYQYLQMPTFGQSAVKVTSQGTLPSPNLKPGEKGYVDIPKGEGDVLQVTATDPHGQEIFTWSTSRGQHPLMDTLPSSATMTETSDDLVVTSAGKTYVFSKQDGHLRHVGIGSRTISFGNGPRFITIKRSDRSEDGFYNHDDKEAFSKKTQYTTYDDQGSFSGFSFENGQLKVKYDHGSLSNVVWDFHDDGSIHFTAYSHFNGVVDMIGITFDYPETQVKSKQWVGNGPYRVWQNREDGPQYGFWQTAYNDPVPGETFEYPEFKGYFSHVKWMQIDTSEGKIGIEPTLPRSGNRLYIGVYQPRDGRDHILYDFPQTGLSLLEAIPAVRNKVNTTDLNGPSAQPYWAKGSHVYSARLRFE